MKVFAALAGGVQLSCSKGGVIIIGDNTTFSGESHIVARKMIKFGDDCTVSWNTQIMDTDSHLLFSNGVRINPDKEVLIGNHVWICSHTIISKGVTIPDECVVACGSIITRNSDMKSNSIIAGLPVKIIKSDVKWER